MEGVVAKRLSTNQGRIRVALGFQTPNFKLSEDLPTAQDREHCMVIWSLSEDNPNPRRSTIEHRAHDGGDGLGEGLVRLRGGAKLGGRAAHDSLR